MISSIRRAVVPILAAITLLSAHSGLSAAHSETDFEVWLIDQSDSNGQPYGGTIHIYDGNDLIGDAAASATPTDAIDLSGATSDLCMASTGAYPIRPHMLYFNSSQSHGVLSFVASGHVVIFNAKTREPVACVRTSVGVDGERQAHAATPAPDDSYILVTNQNGKLLERIDTNYATETFSLNPEATINLTTCETPGGSPCQDAELRPDNAPIVAVVDSSSTLGFITLRGGGLFVVDPKSTPMRILADYDRSTVHGNGFSGVEAGGSMFINSGGGAKTHMHGFAVYRFPLVGYGTADSSNVPAPELLYADEQAERDSHGLVLTGEGDYLWVLDRVQNVAEVFDTETGEHLNTVDLNIGGPAGLAPDLADVSPSGDYIFVSLRGPNPLSGDPHASTGTTPGIGVIAVTELGSNGEFDCAVTIHNLDGEGVERADAHGIRVRLT